MLTLTRSVLALVFAGLLLPANGLADGKSEVKVICVPAHPNAAEIASKVVSAPFQIVYYVIQGPRMVTELVAFGETGEHLARCSDNYRPGITYPGN